MTKLCGATSPATPALPGHELTCDQPAGHDPGRRCTETHRQGPQPFEVAATCPATISAGEGAGRVAQDHNRWPDDYGDDTWWNGLTGASS